MKITNDRKKMFKFLLKAILLILILLIFLVSIVIYNFTSVVILTPTGGLGNQLFEYSAAYSFAKQTNNKLLIIVQDSEQKSKDNISGNYGYYGLSKFDIKADEILFTEDSNKAYLLYLLHILYNDKIIGTVNHILSYINLKIEFVKDGNFFDLVKSIKNKTNRTIYIMYDNFESEIFFKNYSSEIKEFLKVKVAEEDKLSKYLTKLKEKQSFCVHVRRGDMGDPNSLFFIPVDYQKKAINLAKQKLNDPHFFIFSDSIELVKKELGDNNNIEYVSNPELSVIDDFALMSACANNIVANSTFSWWAAYLNPNPNKIIIAPSPRFTNKFLDGFYSNPVIREQKRELYTNHAYPESWIKLNYM